MRRSIPDSPDGDLRNLDIAASTDERRLRREGDLGSVQCEPAFDDRLADIEPTELSRFENRLYDGPTQFSRPRNRGTLDGQRTRFDDCHN
jgi:hypothetical protein